MNEFHGTDAGTLRKSDQSNKMLNSLHTYPLSFPLLEDVLHTHDLPWMFLFMTTLNSEHLLNRLRGQWHMRTWVERVLCDREVIDLWGLGLNEFYATYSWTSSMRPRLELWTNRTSQLRCSTPHIHTQSLSLSLCPHTYTHHQRVSLNKTEQTERNQFHCLTSVYTLIVRWWVIRTSQ
jgi:hypothetical protein